ncbi:MAG TPA: hypothetical protein VGS80_05810 [Ktedonobacterales bacterium]|nr:hypothetical protein [Ktedonobacterales bacterium]
MHLASVTADLAQRTDRAAHAEATAHLLAAIGEVWQAGECLAESEAGA